ncbi:MAG: hypothetical protein PHF00_04880 [Elusimicrobia bacterium]|nr:hypothetical protein [Elusimicrobiota bacterium]
MVKTLYLRGREGHADMSVVERLYPGFLKALAGHEAVGMVAVRSGPDAVLLAKAGKASIRGGRLSVSEGVDPLAGYQDARMSEAALADQIEDYLRLDDAGDVVVFAPYQDGATLDYNDKYTVISEHGGIGDGQMHPFLIYDPAVLAEASRTFRDARDLHRVFKSLKQAYVERAWSSPP